ncbi:segregation and condensation protein A [Serinibacter salmoneus]|uniref:Segregation and condensation protein A n=1 Tax=Serinibacter salmoneus TaxID=556530 RepID=A0A2A9D0D3_9MICO|nr:segregation/condensation protein A [Serinibacter salmoneus]PFG19715.1 condensin subunit ScpA [Serinibacter salmoneus]
MNSSPAATSPEDRSPDRTAQGSGGFEVNLENFSGPFDLLLSLIAKHKMDVTEVALAVVTDDFIAHLAAQGTWELDTASEFLVIGATLLDLKAARLLPGADTEDPEDMELLEARDLLFARLLQYRAYKQVAADLGDRWERAAHSFPRAVALEEEFAALLPELVLAIGPQDLARLAARALTPRPEPVVGISHLHTAVSVAEQAAVLTARLRRVRAATFAELTADADGAGVVVARFLALLDLYRRAAVDFEQAESLGTLTVTWTGGAAEVVVSSEFDEPITSPGD